MVSSIISDQVKSDIESLDSYAARLLQHIDDLELGEQLDSSIEDDIESLKKSFFNVFNLSSQLVSKTQSGTQGKSIEANKLSLSDLSASLAPFVNGCISERIMSHPSYTTLSISTKEHLENICKLEKFILLYNLSLVFLIASNQLLKNTIPLSNQIDYYNDLLNSKTSFAVYCLQTSPIRLYGLANDVYKDVTKISISSASSSLLSPSSSASLQSESVNTATPPPDWLPYQFHHMYRRLYHLKNLVVDATLHNLKKLSLSPNYLLLKNFQKGKPPKFNYVSVMIGAPFYSIRQNIISKRQNLITLQQRNAANLGLLLNHLPDLKRVAPFTPNTSDDGDEVEAKEISMEHITELFENEEIIDNAIDSVDKLMTSFEGGDPLEVDSSYSDLNSSFIKLNKLCNQVLPIYLKQMKLTVRKNQKPSAMVRYWFLAVVGLLYIPSTASTLVTRQAEIRAWIQQNLIETAKGFYRNWILKPFNQILATVRHDSSSEIAIMSQKSLSSDLDSLTRMAIDLAVDNNTSSLNDAQLETLKKEIASSIQAGDLTSIMLNYEHVLKSPVSNLLKGKLLRSLLIQIQKLKVDGDVAMNGIDKLLKSQELVFTVVAASPSLLVVYYILSSINAYWKNGASRFNSSLKPKILSNLNTIERLFIFDTSNDFSNYQADGLILLEVIELRSLGLLVVPKSKRAEWVRDCNDLLNMSFPKETRIQTISRIHRVYKDYL